MPALTRQLEAPFSASALEMRLFIERNSASPYLPFTLAELALERVRRARFGQLPSRIGVTFASRSAERALAFARRYRPEAHAVHVCRLETNGPVWCADMAVRNVRPADSLSPDEMWRAHCALAAQYWLSVSPRARRGRHEEELLLPGRTWVQAAVGRFDLMP